MTAAPVPESGVSAAFARYGPLLTDYAARILGDRDRAADVVQETFLRMCRETRAGTAIQVPEWLYTVCRNHAIDIQRKERRMIQTSDDFVLDRPAANGCPEGGLVRAEAQSALARHVGRLSANQREVLRLRFQHALSYKQIADVTGLSVSNVGFLIHVALKSLRERLSESSLHPSRA